MKEKHIQREIIRFLCALGCTVNDMSQPRATMLPIGLPDLYVQHPTLGVFWVEVKSPTGRVRPSQAEWHEREREAGGTVYVARSAADLIEPLQQRGARID